MKTSKKTSTKRYSTSAARLVFKAITFVLTDIKNGTVRKDLTASELVAAKVRELASNYYYPSTYASCFRLLHDLLIISKDHETICELIDNALCNSMDKNRPTNYWDKRRKLYRMERSRLMEIVALFDFRIFPALKFHENTTNIEVILLWRHEDRSDHAYMWGLKLHDETLVGKFPPVAYTMRGYVGMSQVTDARKLMTIGTGTNSIKERKS